MRHCEATNVNALGALGFPHCGKGTEGGCTRFSLATLSIQ
jgi:hypothetical protein